MFTIDQVIRATDEVLAEIGKDTTYAQRYATLNPDHRFGHYSPCKYLVNGEPACLVGVILDHLGVDHSILRSWDTETNDGSIHLVARGVSEDVNADDDDVTNTEAIPGIDIEDDAVKFLRLAQRDQDNGQTMGAAVAHAKDAWQSVSLPDLF